MNPSEAECMSPSIFYVSTLLGGKEEPIFALQEID